MKINVAIQAEVVKRAIEKVAGLVEGIEIVKDPQAADLVIVDSRRDLLRLLNDHQSFLGMYQAKDEFGEVPANVKTAPVTKLVTELFQLVGELSTKPAVAAEAPAKKVELPADYLRLTTRFKVLVVDDNYDNRVLAGHLLGADHDLMVVDGYGAAMQALDGQMFDAVLTDSQLPLDFYHRSLSDRAIKTTEVLQHQGQWIAFRATMRGANAAVVTDANHHQDWQSAVMDDFREPMEMNGHRLMFINNMGKRWDLALATLMLMK